MKPLHLANSNQIIRQPGAIARAAKAVGKLAFKALLATPLISLLPGCLSPFEGPTRPERNRPAHGEDVGTSNDAGVGNDSSVSEDSGLKECGPFKVVCNMVPFTGFPEGSFTFADYARGKYYTENISRTRNALGVEGYLFEFSMQGNPERGIPRCSGCDLDRGTYSDEGVTISLNDGLQTLYYLDLRLTPTVVMMTEVVSGIIGSGDTLSASGLNYGIKLNGIISNLDGTGSVYVSVIDCNGDLVETALPSIFEENTLGAIYFNGGAIGVKVGNIAPNYTYDALWAEISLVSEVTRFQDWVTPQTNNMSWIGFGKTQVTRNAYGDLVSFFIPFLASTAINALPQVPQCSYQVVQE